MSSSSSSSSVSTLRSSTSPTSLWGRYYQVDRCTVVLSSLLLIFAPFIVLYYHVSCWSYQCSFLAPLKSFSITDLPEFNATVFGVYLAWLLGQAVLYAFLPGKVDVGQETPAGYLLRYKVNGLSAWVITHVLFGALAYSEVIQAKYIAVSWGAFLIAANVFGYLMALVAYIKAKVYPTHPEDCKTSSSFLYDLYMGVELNPRLSGPQSKAKVTPSTGEASSLASSRSSSSDSENDPSDATALVSRQKYYPKRLSWNALWDFKLFFNGRPGIVAWTLIDISFAVGQYAKYETVTNSMLLVLLLQAVYVVDFFYYEGWYLRTIDIAHDHFGFYLAWGDLTWLPFMYTLQAQYLYWHPVDLPHWYAMVVAAIGAAGYYIFRSVNNQKDIVRKTNGECKIWGKKPTVVRTKYVTTDGKEHESLLLASGFWGLSRHFNYLGDLLLSLAMCLSVGIGPVNPLPDHASRASWINAIDYAIVPYFYIYYMIILLVHRIYRDDARCRGKYGQYWEEYCKLVPSKLIPGVF